MSKLWNWQKLRQIPKERAKEDTCNRKSHSVVDSGDFDFFFYNDIIHFSLSCIGEGNGNPLQCSCLENPRDGGAWWAAIYGVAQSWTRLKQLSSKCMEQRIEWKEKRLESEGSFRYEWRIFNLVFIIHCCHCCSVSKLCHTLCDPMDCSAPGFSVLHYLPEFAQTHVHWVSDAI